jgi:general secretion pathway protein C
VSVDLIFKKYFYAIVLALAALAAFFQASGVSQLLSAMFAPGSGPTFAPMIAAKTKSFVLPGVGPIHDRNPFDSVTGALNKVEVVETEAEPEKLSFDDPLTVPHCAGVTVFILTESEDPLWSFAAVKGPSDSSAKLRRVGDSVGEYKVSFIGFNPSTAAPTMWLESATALCQSSLFGVEPIPPAPDGESSEGDGEDAARKAGKPDEKKADSRAIDPSIKAQIKKISDTEFEIDRSAVEKILADQAQLMSSARIVPEQKDGKTVGIRLFGVRPDTLLGTLGLKNGDRLEQINGFDMGSPERALEAYARLRTAENLKLTLNRRGQSTTIRNSVTSVERPSLPARRWHPAPRVVGRASCHVAELFFWASPCC